MSRMKPVVAIMIALILVAIPVMSACTKEIIKEVPVERVVEKEVIKEVPVEKVVVKEVIKEVPVERIVEKLVPAPVSRKPVGTLTYAANSLGNENWLPWGVGSIEAAQMSRSMESLITFDVPTADYICMLCESWELSDDALTATFYLRKGIQFHDGWGELTAEDVKYTFDRNMSDESIWSEKSRSVSAGVVAEVIDPYTFVFRGEKTFSRLIFSTARIHGTIASKKYVESVGDEAASKRMIGTGPWRMVEHKVGEYIRYEAVEDHWRQTPYFKTLIVKKVPEESTRIAMMKAGEADIIDMSLAYVDELEQSGFEPRFFLTTMPIYVNFGGQYLPDRETYDPSQPWVGPADDENAMKVRKAMNLAIDKEAIIEHILMGKAEPNSVPIYNPGEPWSDPAWKPAPYDLDEAKKLMAEAGYPDGFDLTLISWVSSGRDEGPAVAEAVSIYWDKLGISTKLQPMEYAGLRPLFKARTIPKDTMWVYVGTRSGREPYEALGVVAYGKGTYCLFCTEYPELDAILERAQAERDIDKRAQIQIEWGQWVIDHWSVIPIATKGMTIGLNKRVGYWPMAEGITSIPMHFEFIEHGSEK